MKIKDTFKQFGLNERQTDIYIYVLQNIESSAYKIAQSLKTPRATVYNDLEHLIEQQFITKVKKNGKWYFSAEPIKHQKSLLEEKMQLIDSLIPDINELRKQAIQSPEIKIYTGKKGIKTVFEKMMDQLKQKDVTQRFIFSHPNITDQLPLFIKEWAREKERLGIFTHSIAPEGIGPASKIPEIYQSNALREIRFIPEKYLYDISISLDGNLLTFFVIDQGNLYAITIESPVVTRMVRQIFLFIWDQLAQKSL